MWGDGPLAPLLDPPQVMNCLLYASMLGTQIGNFEQHGGFTLWPINYAAASSFDENSVLL